MRWLAVMAMLLAMPAAAQVARIDSGALHGKREGAVSAFLGIPFAAPPTGANRWRAPQPAAHWKGVRDATRFGPDCEQALIPNRGAIGPWTWEYLPQGPVSEDCLFVNVWTPSARPGAKLPVLLWIYGGGFTGGGSSVPLYDGAALAARGIVVVSVNYRLGVYGFLAHPELTREASTSGNYALMDQVAGLEWIRRNIATFRGDPAQVTIAGQSAGAASVHALLASPQAKGLFHRAIVQSGTVNPWPSLAVAERVGERFAQAAGAASLADLRALTPAQIAAAARDLRFGPVNGTPIVPDQYAEAAGIPVLVGLAADEGSALSPEYKIADAAGLRASLEQRYGAQAEPFLALYAAPDDATAQASARASVRDRGLAALLAWTRGRTAYGYLYTHPEPGSQPQYRAFHSAELAYVFGTLAVTPERPFTDTDRAIAQRMGDYWANFVKTGDPNGPGLPAWPRLDSGLIMELGAAFAPRPPLSPGARATYDAYLAGGGRP